MGLWEATEGFRGKKKHRKAELWGKNLGIDIGCRAGERWVKGDRLGTRHSRPRVIPQAHPRAALMGGR